MVRVAAAVRVAARLQVGALEPRPPVDEHDDELERLALLQVVLAERLERVRVRVGARVRVRVGVGVRARVRGEG